MLTNEELIECRLSDTPINMTIYSRCFLKKDLELLIEYGFLTYIDSSDSYNCYKVTGNLNIAFDDGEDNAKTVNCKNKRLNIMKDSTLIGPIFNE